MPTKPRPAGENKGAVLCLAAKIVVVEVIEPEQGVQTGCAGLCALLPVHPPEINTLVLKRMVEIFKIRVCESGVGNIKVNRTACRWVLPKLGCHCWIRFFVGVDAFGRVEVEGSF